MGSRLWFHVLGLGKSKLLHLLEVEPNEENFEAAVITEVRIRSRVRARATQLRLG